MCAWLGSPTCTIWEWFSCVVHSDASNTPSFAGVVAKGVSAEIVSTHSNSSLPSWCERAQPRALAKNAQIKYWTRFQYNYGPLAVQLLYLFTRMSSLHFICSLLVRFFSVNRYVWNVGCLHESTDIFQCGISFRMIDYHAWLAQRYRLFLVILRLILLPSPSESIGKEKQSSSLSNSTIGKLVPTGAKRIGICRRISSLPLMVITPEP